MHGIMPCLHAAEDTEVAIQNGGHTHRDEQFQRVVLHVSVLVLAVFVGLEDRTARSKRGDLR